jgi:SAM-dependent methyltransferase
MNFHQTSKELHKEYRKEFWAGAFDPSHPDTMRHYELLSSSDGLLDHTNPSSILSVGDNLARDAGYFKKKFPHAHCIASDLYADGILEAVSRGYVDSVISADIEKLPFEDSEIDCVIAKEAFHHWPRPMLGLYEMLRVAKKAILLIEPYDVMRLNPAPLIDDNTFCDQYEPVGNYKYQISLREIIKTAWSLYYPAVAAIGFNDPYDPSTEFEQWLVEKTKLDLLGDEGARQFNLMSIAIYKPGWNPEMAKLPLRVKLFVRPLNPFMANDSL